jgi:hypothetical protein
MNSWPSRIGRWKLSVLQWKLSVLAASRITQVSDDETARPNRSSISRYQTEAAIGDG